MKTETRDQVGLKSNKRYISSLLSFFYMGLGQLFNGQYIKGTLFAVYFTTLVTQSTGTFLKQFQGLYTLGVTPGEDHSIFLLIKGIFYALLFIAILAIHIGNVVDAYKNGKQRDLGREVPNFKQSIKNFIANGYPYLTIGPGLLFLTISTIIPIIFTVCLAFTNYDLYHSPPGNLVDWVGIDNYIQIFQMTTWWNTLTDVFSWTVIWTLSATFTTFGLGLFLAIVLNHPKIKFRKFFRTVLIVPWAIPAFISILIWRGLLNFNFGHINKILSAVGFGAVPWLQDPIWAKVAIVMVNLWLGFPFTMALCSGVLQNIPQELYQAAEVDGASAWQKFRHITLPLVLYSIAPLIIMQFSFNLNNFGIVYLLTEGGPPQFGMQGAGSTDIIISWIYRLTFTKMKYNYAAGLSILLFLVVAGFSIYQFRRTSSFQDEEMMQ